jgi:hypothetical protein
MQITNDVIRNYLECKHKIVKINKLNYGKTGIEKQNEIISQNRYQRFLVQEKILLRTLQITPVLTKQKIEKSFIKLIFLIKISI